MEFRAKQGYLRRAIEFFGLVVRENDGSARQPVPGSAHAGYESHLQNIIDGANLGYWDWDYRTGRQQVNDRWLEMLGLDRDDIENHVDDCIVRMHPDDRQNMDLDNFKIINDAHGHHYTKDGFGICYHSGCQF